MQPQRTSQRPRSLYNDSSDEDEDESTRGGHSRPGAFSSLLLGTNIIAGVQREDSVSALKRTRDSDGDESDDMLTQTAKSQSADKERRNTEANQARERQKRLQVHNPASSTASSCSNINSGSGSSSTFTHEESSSMSKVDPASVSSKRISYAEMEQLARRERMEELASFTALSQAPTLRSAGTSHPGLQPGWDDSDDDEWMDRAEVVGRAEQAEATERQQAQTKRKHPAQRESSSSAGSAVSANRGSAIAENKKLAVDVAAHSAPDAPDALGDEDAGSEHPSCELKSGCQRIGALLLPAFDAAAEPKQKGIVGKNSAIEAVSASELNQACASRLLPHQIVGVQWLWRKYALGQGAILGDGKNCMFAVMCALCIALVFLCLTFPVLIVCGVSSQTWAWAKLYK